MKKQYNKNKLLRVGDTCICPSCNTLFTKEHYQQVFCKTRGGTVCKDAYWNFVTPNKRNNKTRISPASAAYMASREKYYPYNDFDDDMSWDAHKDSF